MPQISISKTYSDEEILFEQDLDNIREDVQTFLNVTKIDSDNIQDAGIETAKIEDGAITNDKIADGTIDRDKAATSLEQALVPSGACLPYAGSSAPGGFLLCDGTAVSRTIYADLFAAIGESHGNGDGSTTFNLPDFRGRFIRGVDDSAGRDPDAGSRTAMQPGGNTGDDVGTVQDDAMLAHTHSDGSLQALIGTDNTGGLTLKRATASPTYNGVAHNTGAGEFPVSGDSRATDVQGTTGSTSTGSGEVRPINAYVNFIIKT